MGKCLRNLSPQFFYSSRLKTFIETKCEQMKKDRHNVYVYIKDVLDEVKKNRKGGTSEASEMSDIQNSPQKKIDTTTVTAVAKSSVTRKIHSDPADSSSKDPDEVESMDEKDNIVEK